MFGHSDNQQSVNSSAPGQSSDSTANNMSQNDPAQQQVADSAASSGFSLNDIPTTQPQTPQFQQPQNPFTTPSPQSQTVQKPDLSAPMTPTTFTATADDNLADLKQKALQELSPLVNQLEQSPEEKFKTTMMMIQASDDQSLLPSAYEAAQAITDEKARAQALLDVVNEINYFTQSK